MRKIIEKIKTKMIVFSALITTTLINIAPAYADQISDTADNAADGIHATSIDTLKPIVIIICVVAGILLTTAGERGKQTVQSKIGAVLIGIGLILFAPDIVTTIIGWFE